MRISYPAGLTALLVLAGCGRTPSTVAPSSNTVIASLPAEALALFPAGSTIVDSQALGANGTTAVLVAIANRTVSSGGSAPPMAELAIVSKTPSGWRLGKAVVQDFAQAPKLDVVQVSGAPTAGLEYHTGANSQGLIAVRDSAVVFDGVADSVQFQDLDQDGSAEVVKSWSPFCQSHVASPRLNTIYAWTDGTYAAATGRYASAIARDVANFQAAVTRANSSQTTPAWTGRDKACLHDALAYLAELSGDQAGADAQYAQVRQLDASYDPQTIAKQAAAR